MGDIAISFKPVGSDTYQSVEKCTPLTFEPPHAEPPRCLNMSFDVSYKQMGPTTLCSFKKPKCPRKLKKFCKREYGSLWKINAEIRCAYLTLRAKNEKGEIVRLPRCTAITTPKMKNKPYGRWIKSK